MINAHDCDVLVIGAGPAGASTALTLLNHTNLSVTLIEGSDFQRLRIGESVSSSLFSLLDYLQVPKTNFPAGCFKATQGNSAFWGSSEPVNRHAIFAPDRATFQVNREAFDLTLLEHIVAQGGNILPRTKSKIIKQLPDGAYSVNVKHPEYGDMSITCRYLVDASGRNSKVSKALGATVEQYDRLTGVGGFFKIDGMPLEQIQLIESDEGGWWYSAALTKQIMVMTYFSDFELLSKQKLNRTVQWQEYLKQSQHMRKRIEGMTLIDDSVWVRPAGSHFCKFAQLKNYLPVGDAACAFDPISSMGIGFAITSGCQAARIIGNSLSEANFAVQSKSYQQDLSTQFNQYLTLKQQFYCKEQRWQNAPFWSVRQQYMNQVA